MAEFATPLTVDQDIWDFEPALDNHPTIAGKVARLHEAASDEIARALRTRWWADIIRGVVRSPFDRLSESESFDESMRTLDGMDTSKLSRDQLKRVAVFRLLGWHIWPRLDTHNEEATYPVKRAAKWKKDYAEELESILGNGVAYDWDGDGVAELYSEAILGRNNRTVRLQRE